MTFSDIIQLSDTQEHYLVVALQSVLACLLLGGLVLRQYGVAINGAVTLSVTFLPALLKREFRFTMDPGLVLWLTVAMVLHAIGMLGLYSQYTWYDEITHTVSATIIAGIGYASFRALELHSPDIDVPSQFRVLFIVVFVLAAGVFWEVLEFVFGGVVIVYGIDDIVTDMVFNTFGAVLVAVWGTGYVGGLVGFFWDRLRTT